MSSVVAPHTLPAERSHAASRLGVLEHRQAVWMFTAAAVFQLAWGDVALRRDGPITASIGILGNGALFAGWLLAKRSGVSFVDGLEDAEPAQLAGEVAAVVPPKAYDPTKPIDLSGVDGVTPDQQARAENLLAATLLRLPPFSDQATAEAVGFRSIHDEGSTLETVPDVGGPLSQWHIHDDLCFTDDSVSPVVVGVTSVGGSCPLPSLEGIPAGQIAPGETRLCDHVHGGA